MCLKNFYSESSRDLILAFRPMFLAMGNHLEPFSKVSHPPESQEQGGEAVGGQDDLVDVDVVILGRG